VRSSNLTFLIFLSILVPIYSFISFPLLFCFSPFLRLSFFLRLFLLLLPLKFCPSFHYSRFLSILLLLPLQVTFLLAPELVSNPLSLSLISQSCHQLYGTRAVTFAFLFALFLKATSSIRLHSLPPSLFFLPPRFIKR